ncbi:MAG: haloacid dehalogenase type II [Proteobacteria bacterium]|nr:haloacid dehalogenase type II [Pseudomonadota bacterium]
MRTRAVVFDAYGTLYDVQSVAAAAERHCPGRGDLITQVWRLKQLEYTWLRSLMGAPPDFALATRQSLAFALKGAGVAPEPALLDALAEEYLRLALYPEARAALEALSGVKRAILSNGTAAMLAPLVEGSGIRPLLDAVISVEGSGAFKPSPACYRLVEQVLGVPPDAVLFVSSNGFDVAGAKAFGFRVAQVVRGGAAAPPQAGPVAPAALFRLLRGRTEALGLDADHVVGSLMDLAGLVD